MWKRDTDKEKPSKKDTPEYKKPKILLIDLPDSVLDSVRSAGFNASAGTFGSPYKVELSDSYRSVIGKPDLPNYTEQEIIIIDLLPPKRLDNPEGEKMTSEGENDWWAKCSWGEIDPRPRAMYMAQNAFDRIFDHGGLFVIFAQPRLRQDLFLAHVVLGSLNVGSTASKIHADNWGFLSILSSLRIESDFGKEINVLEHDTQLSRFLRGTIRNARYNATFNPLSGIEKNWKPILSNKFEKCVGGLIVPEDSKGRVLILPQISKKPEAIVTLLREVLPDISPHLFPHIEGYRWVEREEYELDSVLKYKANKIEVQQRAKREFEELDKKIVEERDKLGFLHGIITKTGTDLVESVKSCLEFIGFKQVIDVDKQILERDANAPKQEDLQVHKDKSPTLLIEIKGISGLPHESDTIQVVKYILRRMKEWNREDVHGVSIINHQRNVPALERDNQNIFTKQQVEDAENHDFTILTTWDLFLLIRGMMKWGWDPKTIQELFYKSGRMPRLPTIYKPIGEIVKYWEKPCAVGVQISENKLKKGERIGYVTPEGYLEEEALSLQVENQDVDEVFPGQLVGIKTKYPKNLLRRGTIVCAVTKGE